jgi:cell division protein FtsW
VGLVAWLASETVINIGAVVGVLPVTGIPLPFISYGGSSLVITMAAAGILINVARQEVSGPPGSMIHLPRRGRERATDHPSHPSHPSSPLSARGRGR